MHLTKKESQMPKILLFGAPCPIVNPSNAVYVISRLFLHDEESSTIACKVNFDELAILSFERCSVMLTFTKLARRVLVELDSSF